MLFPARALFALLLLGPQTAQIASAQHPAAPPPAAVDMMKKAPVSPSRSISIRYASHTTQLTLDDLLAMPQTTVHVHNAHRNADEDYTGPLMALVLEKAGLMPTKGAESVILHSAVVATGTDGYSALYAAAETMPTFSKETVIVAVTKAGQPDKEGGLIQVINTGDARPARWVHGLAALLVLDLSDKTLK